MATFRDRAKLESQLQDSPTALTPGVKPTERDLSVEKELKKADMSADMKRSNALKERWYGPTPKKDVAETPVEHNPGLLERLGKNLGAPIAAMVGAVKHFQGEGTGDLFGDMESNIESGATFGDITRKALPNHPVIAGAAGFGLDVVLDPVGGISAGTAKLGPRVLQGVSKAGVTGAKAAVKSRALTFAEDIVRKISPKYREIASGQATAKVADSWMGRLAKLARENSDAYDQLMDGGVEKLIEKAGERKLIYQKVMSTMADAVGEKRAALLRTWFSYDDAGWATKKFAESEKIIDEIARSNALDNVDAAGIEVPLSRKARARKAGERDAISFYQNKVNSGLDESLPVISGYEPGVIPDPTARAASISYEAAQREAEAKALDDAMRDFGDLMDDNEKAKQWLATQTPDVQREYMEAWNKRKLANSSLPKDVREHTKKWDTSVANVLMNSKARKTLRVYDAAIGFFKNAAIGPNVPLHVSSLLGNFASTNMFGVATDATYLKTWKKAVKAIYSEDPNAIKGTFGSMWDEVIDKHPEIVRDVLGVNPYLLKFGQGMVDAQIDELTKTLARQGAHEDIIKQANEVKQMFKNLRANEAAALKRQGRAMVPTAKVPGTAEDITAESTFQVQELYDTSSKQVIDWLGKKGADGNKVAKALHWTFTRPVEEFGKIDQVHRIATAKHLVENGISETELRKISRWMGGHLKPEDVTKSPTGNVFYLSPKAALDLSSRIYLNYQAMPAFIRMMRHLPVLGAPFASYAYGNTANVLRSMNVDPSWINNVNFLIKEVSGEKTPAEKKALSTKYYEFLQDPNWAKMQWFKNNPMYLNLSSFFPQFQVGLLRSSKEKYADRYANAFGRALDILPVFKTPEGEMMLEYVILPMMLDEELSSSGQRTYPADASFGEKAGLAASGMMSNWIPRTPAAAAAFIPYNPPDAVMPYLPRPYSKLKNALQGRTPIGATSLTNTPAELTAKAVSGELGFPVQEVNTK